MKPGKALLTIFILPFVFIIPAFFALFQKPLSVLPWDKRVFYADAYADGADSLSKRGSSVDSPKKYIRPTNFIRDQ